MAGDLFKKVQSGQPFRMPAATFNAFVDAAVAHQQDQDALSHYATEFRQASIIRVKNETGSDQPRFACLGIDAPIILPSDNQTEFSNRVALRCTTPATDDHADGRFVILLEPLKAGTVGQAFAAGVCPVKLLVEDAEAEEHRFADIQDGSTQLAAKSAGAATILWKENVTGGPGVEAWAVIRLGGGAVLEFHKAEMIDDLEQGQAGAAQAWLLEWDGADWVRTVEQIEVYGDQGFRGVLFGATPEVDAGDIADIYYSTDAERWYAVTGGWYFHGEIVNNDIGTGQAGEVKLNVGAGEDAREIIVDCYSPYGAVTVGDFVAANWNTFSVHWDVMKVEGPVDPGCGLEIVNDEQDPEDGKLRVNNSDLAGPGLTTGSGTCDLAVLPGCGTFIGPGVNVDSSQLAGEGLTPGAGICDLDVDTGCGLRFFGNALEVDPGDLVGLGLLAGVADCHMDVDISCGLEFDGNSIKVRPEDVAGAGLEGDLFQPQQCYIQVSFPPNAGLAFDAGDQLVVDMTGMTGPGITTWTNPSGFVGVQADPGCGLELDGAGADAKLQIRPQDIAGAGLEGDLFQPGECMIQVDFGTNCGLAFDVGDKLVLDLTPMAGPGLQAWTNPSGCVGLQVDCQWIEENCDSGGIDVGCGLQLDGDIVAVNPADLASGDIVPDGEGCALRTSGFTGAKQVVTAIDCDPYDPYACPVAVIETWQFEHGLLQSVS